MTQTIIYNVQTTRKRMIVAIACISGILLAVILKWGWLSGVFMLALTVALEVLLFKLFRLARNDYARYFSYSVAVLFAVKTVFSVVSCFEVFVGGS